MYFHFNDQTMYITVNVSEQQHILKQYLYLLIIYIHQLLIGQVVALIIYPQFGRLGLGAVPRGLVWGIQMLNHHNADV